MKTNMNYLFPLPYFFIFFFFIIFIIFSPPPPPLYLTITAHLRTLTS